jgi:death-on-curing protein
MSWRNESWRKRFSTERVAMARPVNLVHYASAENPPDAAQLAASYGFGLACNHPFMDGNKRTAFVAIELFLQLNGYVLVASDHHCVSTILQLAAGDLSEEDLALWIRSNMAGRVPSTHGSL